MPSSGLERQPALPWRRGMVGTSQRLLTTPAIYLRAIRAGLLSVAEADADKALLASRRFVMRFASFADLLNSEGGV